MADTPRIVRDRVLDRDGSGDRYRLHEVLGTGSTGSVFRASDLDLAREVAIKVVAGGDAAAELMREARLAAGLEHPNVVPVYDVGRTDDGRPWMAMRRIEGHTLADEIAHAGEGAIAPLVVDRMRLASAMIQVCNAIAAAHARGVLHRDIKPANILLGAYGEVLVVDWGSASRHDGERAATGGSPWYMSPALARGDPVTPACDVYAIGATLLHALLLRPPLDAPDEEAFWRRKRAGEIDAPTQEERARVPRHLLAIALKATRVQPAQRYASVGELAEDLLAWQSGQPVSACGDTALERARRALRRYGKRLLVAGAIAASLLTAAGVVFGERVKEFATWGAPTVQEHFSDDAWTARWNVLDGGWRRDGDRLVSTAEHQSLLLWPQRLEGATAIEYVGEILPGAKPCDISLIWARSYEPGRPLADEIKVQIGAYDGAYTAILVPGHGNAAYHAFKPEPGRRYHVRVEIVDDRITLLVDGARLCSYRDPLPLTGGYAMLYAYYPGKAFSDVRISSLGTPARVPPTAVGDGFAERGEWDAARAAYLRVVASFAGQPLGEQALYRAGLCQFRAGRFDDASATWARVHDPLLSRLIGVHRLEHRLDMRPDDLGDDLAAACADPDEDVRERARGLWCRAMLDGIDVETRHAKPSIARLVELRDRVMPDSLSTERVYVDGLFAQRRYQEILGRFPGQRLWCALSLVRLNRVDDALRDYTDQRAACCQALLTAGRWDDLRRRLPEQADSVLDHRFADGRHWLVDWPLGIRPLAPRADEAAMRALFAGGPAAVTDARPDGAAELARRLHAHEPLDGYRPASAVTRDRLLLATGRDDELFTDVWDRDEFTRRDAAALRAIAASGRSDAAAMGHWLEVAAAGIDPIDAGWCEQVLAPFLRELGGEHGAVAHECQQVLAKQADCDVGRSAWRARVLLGQASDDDFLAQPLTAQADAELVLLHALRAELAGDSVAATAAYVRYLRLPTWRRTCWLPDPADALARARAAALGR